MIKDSGFYGSRSKILLSIFLISVFSLAVPNRTNAQTHIIGAASPSYTDVRTAISSARSGDTVVIPAGSATWASALSVPAGISLMGSGIGKTVITCSAMGLDITTENGKPFTISGLEFRISADSGIRMMGTCRNFRITGCRVYSLSTSQTYGIFIGGLDDPDVQYGIIDNCDLVNVKILVNTSGGLGDISWKTETGLGTDSAVYVEDCTFSQPNGLFDNCIDTNYGSRYVFRHNKVKDNFIMGHPLQNGGPDYFGRGTRKVEIYENTIDATNSANHWAAISLEAGTGVIFNNTVRNSGAPVQFEYPVILQTLRYYADGSGQLTKADGHNPIDGNTDATGYPLLDQIGRGRDRGTTPGIPRYTGTDRLPQALEPVYVWNNTLDGAVTKAVITNGCEIGIKEGRDYYNTAKPGYQPYQYPHPLRRTTRKVDFNGDHNEDILWRYYGSGGSNLVWFLGGYAAAGLEPMQPAAIGTSPQNPTALAMQQGRAPLVYWDVTSVGGFRDTQAGAVFFEPDSQPRNGDIHMAQAQMAASGGPVFSSPALGPRILMQNILTVGYLPTVVDVNWQIVGTGDFDNDGKIDILWRHATSGQNVVWFMNGIVPTGYSYLPTVSDLSWKIVGTGDFNNSGNVDILWRNFSTGENLVWYMNGATYISIDYLPVVKDLNWQIVGTGDFKGDGETDILWRNFSTGQNAVWFMNGSTYVSSEPLATVADTHWGIMGTGDFNGDRKPDIIWRNSSTGQNAIWYMNGMSQIGNEVLQTVTDSNWKIVNR
jgi:hypothetical protein